MKRVHVPLMLAILIASAAHADNGYYCPSSPSTPYIQQLAQIAVSRALPVGSDIP
ncbi:fimbrial protein, partial [Klebsiella michiganensis]